MKSTGYTLVELLVVLAFLTIFALVVSPIVLHVIQSSKANLFSKNLNQFLLLVEKDAEKRELSLEGEYRYQTEKLVWYDGETEIPIEIEKTLSKGYQGIGFLENQEVVSVILYGDGYCGISSSDGRKEILSDKKMTGEECFARMHS